MPDTTVRRLLAKWYGGSGDGGGGRSGYGGLGDGGGRRGGLGGLGAGGGGGGGRGGKGTSLSETQVHASPDTVQEEHIDPDAQASSLEYPPPVARGGKQDTYRPEEAWP